MRPVGRARRLLTARPPKAQRPRRDEEEDDDWYYEVSPTVGSASSISDKRARKQGQIGFRPPQER